MNPNAQKKFPLVGNSKDKVAYFKDSKGTIRSFATIESALLAAASGDETNTANTIYVIPGTNPTINSDCTIASKDTLCLPYENETYNGRQRNSKDGKTSNNSWKNPVVIKNGKPVSGDYLTFSNVNTSIPFPDWNEEYCNYFKKNEVTISANRTLSVSSGAFLQIGGILGWDGRGVTGQTSGKYCQITRRNGSKIINEGAIDCRGFIKEDQKNSNIVLSNEAGSSLYAPFVFYDYQGGTYTASVYGGNTKIFPLHQYDFPNLHCKTIFKHTSKLFGYVDLFTDKVERTVAGINATLAARHNTDILEFIGPRGEKDSKGNTISHLFETENNSSSFVRSRVVNGNKFSSFKNKGSECETQFSIYGSCDFNSTAISINAADDAKLRGGALDWLLRLLTSSLNQTITTDSVDFPLPWNFKISVKSGGILTILNNRKIRPGGEIGVDQTGSLNINKKLIVYDDSLNSTLYSCPSSGVDSPYPDGKGNGKITTKGKVNIKSGSSFGGRITAEGVNAKINIESGVTLSNVQSCEGTGSWAINGTDIVFTFNNYSNSPITKSASGIHYRKYYRTDIAPDYLYENDGEQILIEGETYTSYSIESSPNSYGWYDSNGISNRFGIVFNYQDSDGKEIDCTNPNENANVDSYASFVNNGEGVKLKALIPTDKNEYSFVGYYYKNLAGEKIDLVLDNETNMYTLDSATAFANLNSNNLLIVYSKWDDASKGFYTIETKSKKQDPNKGTILTEVTNPVEHLVSEQIILNKEHDRIYYYKNLLNNGKGYLHVCHFSGYSLSVSNDNGLQKTIAVDLNGNSSANGVMLVESFVVKDSDFYTKNNKIVIEELYDDKATAFEFTLNTGSGELRQGEERIVSVNVPDIFSTTGITLKAENWSSNDSTGGHRSTPLNLSCGFKNNYSGKAKRKKTVSVDITCSIMDGSINLGEILGSFKAVSVRFSIF